MLNLSTARCAWLERARAHNAGMGGGRVVISNVMCAGDAVACVEFGVGVAVRQRHGGPCDSCGEQ